MLFLKKMKGSILSYLLIAQLVFLVSTYFVMEGNLVNVAILNLLFLVGMLLVSYASKASRKNDLQGVQDAMRMIEDYYNMKINRVKEITCNSNSPAYPLIEQMNKFMIQMDNGRKDDMKVLGQIVLVMNKTGQGIYRCRVEGETENFMITELKKTVNKMLDRAETNITELERALTEYKSDNYANSIKLDPILKEQMKSIITGVNELGEVLRSNAVSNLNNGEELERNSLTMNASVENVAKKANEQAASLEETAAAVEEITSITKNNVENAVKMGDLGHQVSTSVDEGLNKANQTAQSMEEINEQVKSINDAISVIDQIAFQTNILSLNAAVEAATAGEAGKGFAVVAQEVRNLASRSAEAAKEIKDMVSSATEKASEGKEISDGMIDGYNKLTTNISETTSIINDVSDASKEQLSGIEQINNAINMLDRITQENAAEASEVAQISTKTLEMAQNLLNEAKTKKVN